MVRYIDADELLNRLPDNLPYKSSVKRVLIQAPDADVVPESEVEELIRENESLAKTVNEASELIHKLRSKVEKAKAEVAREFIDATDEMLDLVCAMTGLELTFFGKYAELRKKYTGGE